MRFSFAMRRFLLSFPSRFAPVLGAVSLAAFPIMAEDAAPDDTKPPGSDDAVPPAKAEIATFGAGCFWCIEAVLEQLEGVIAVQSGYMGGTVKNPTYKQICTGNTGHAEVVQVRFDPGKITYEALLDYFWRLHDPTTLNRQGADVGTQYRSAIFYHSEAQKKAAEESKRKLEEAGVFEDPVVTEITAAVEFYEAEEYHQDFYQQNRENPYCRVVIRPKLEKLGLKK